MKRYGQPPPMTGWEAFFWFSIYVLVASIVSYSLVHLIIRFVT
jgi:hypothetical protein